MAKTNVKITEPPATSMATLPPSGVPAFMADRIAQDAGKGVSTDQADNLIPLIYVLQALSPQCNKRAPEWVEGAEPGALYLRSSANPIVSGEEGLLFQPCAFSKDWVEWVPRDNGGGFVGRYKDCPAEAQRMEDPKNPAKVKFVLPNGNEVIETRYHIGYALPPGGNPVPYVIPMASSGHTVSRQWMFMMSNKAMGSGIAPSWACLYRLKTKERVNKKGDRWFAIDVHDAGWVQSEAEYERGAKLHASVAAGEKAIGEEEAVSAEVANSDVM